MSNIVAVCYKHNDTYFYRKIGAKNKYNQLFCDFNNFGEIVDRANTDGVKALYIFDSNFVKESESSLVNVLEFFNDLANTCNSLLRVLYINDTNHYLGSSSSIQELTWYFSNFFKDLCILHNVKVNLSCSQVDDLFCGITTIYYCTYEFVDISRIKRKINISFVMYPWKLVYNSEVISRFNSDDAPKVLFSVEKYTTLYVYSNALDIYNMRLI